MKYAVALFIAVSAAWAANNEERISKWQVSEGISEAEALKRTRDGIERFLTWEDEGETCTADKIWAYEYDEANLGNGLEAFAVTAYASGPYEFCSGYRDFDCRTVFAKVEGRWVERYTDCEPKGFEE